MQTDSLLECGEGPASFPNDPPASNTASLEEEGGALPAATGTRHLTGLDGEVELGELLVQSGEGLPQTPVIRMVHSCVLHQFLHVVTKRAL